MTRKQFQEMANEFGSILRDIDDRFPHGSSEHLAACDYVRECIYSWSRIAKADNPKFDQEKTDDWIADVRYGRRNLDGKKVAA
jgi:hypothetical protein